MPSKAEKYSAKHFGLILSSLKIGDRIKESKEFQDALGGLEIYVPEILSDKYAFWKGEGLDGFYCSDAIKSGPYEAKLLGMCILISDQSLTPFYFNFGLSDSLNRFEWLVCKLGENGKNGLIRHPYESWPKELHKLRVDSITWEFEISFGEKTKSRQKKTI
jgi:hypothetical protein